MTSQEEHALFDASSPNRAGDTKVCTSALLQMDRDWHKVVITEEQELEPGFAQVNINHTG